MKSFKKAFRKGFSLIELSVVLIIIGLLMAAIIKGRDLIRSAEMKKFYNTFVKAWELVYTQYYDRTGIPLGGPLYVNNTGDVYKIPEYVGANFTSTSKDFVLRAPKTIVKRAKDVGLELPKGNINDEYRYRVTFTDADYSTVWVLFGSDPVRNGESLSVCKNDNCTNIASVSGKGDGRGNFMILVNVPYDVAAQIDRIIDGRADGENGNVVCVNAYSSAKTLSDSSISVDEVFGTKSIEGTYSCGGSLGWGDPSTNKYVTLMYKLGI